MILIRKTGRIIIQRLCWLWSPYRFWTASGAVVYIKIYAVKVCKVEIVSCSKIVSWKSQSSACAQSCPLPINGVCFHPAQNHTWQLDAKKWVKALQWGKAPERVLRLWCGLNAKCLWLTDPLPLKAPEANQNSQVWALKGIYFPLPFFLTLMYTHSVYKNNQQDTPLQVCLWEWGSHYAFKMSCFFLGILFIFSFLLTP